MTKKKSAGPAAQANPAPPQKNDPENPTLPKSGSVVKVERMADDHWLLTRLKDHYLSNWKQEHTNDKQPRPYFYFSDSGRCVRRRTYDFLHPGEKRDMAVGTILMFTFGELFHDEIENTLRVIGASSAKNIEFGVFDESQGYRKSGRFDTIITELGPAEADPERNVPFAVLLDVKSKTSYAMETEPPTPEVNQLISYIDGAFRSAYLKAKNRNIARYGYLLYVDRGGMNKEQLILWRVEFSEERLADIKREDDFVWRCVQEKVLPDRPYTRDSIDCQYCRYQEFCWADIPLPAPATLEPDASLEPPSQEIIESLAAKYVAAKASIKEAEALCEIAEKALVNYFKAKGQTELRVGGTAITYEAYDDTSIDVPYLLKHARDRWWQFAKPTMTLLRAAVDEQIISGTLFEKAILHEQKFRLRRKKVKEV